MGDSESFARAVTAQAAAHACIAVGAGDSYSSVLDSLTDLTAAYIEAIGRAAYSSAERAGRSSADINLVDVMTALTQVMPRISSGGVQLQPWRQLQQWAFDMDAGQPVGSAPPNWEQPFHIAVPRFPVRRVDEPTAGSTADQQQHQSALAISNGLNAAAAALPQYIPSHLPPLPPAHTMPRRHDAQQSAGVDTEDLRGRRLKRKREASEALRRLEGGAAAADSVDSTGNELALTLVAHTRPDAQEHSGDAESEHWPHRKQDKLEQWSYEFAKKPPIETHSVATPPAFGSDQLRNKQARHKDDFILEGSFLDEA